MSKGLFHDGVAGHSSTVVDLSAAADQPGILASLAKDGTLKVWDVARETCLATHATDAACLVRMSGSFGTKSVHLPMSCWDLAVLQRTPSDLALSLALLVGLFVPC